MTQIGERIGKIIEERGISNADFARVLNISPAYVSKLIHRRGIPSERLIEDICEKFDINEEWLNSGRGQMQTERTGEEIIAGFVGRVLRERTDTFQKRFLYRLACMDEEGWENLEECLKRFQGMLEEQA